jgi:hypothetical protein
MSTGCCLVLGSCWLGIVRGGTPIRTVAKDGLQGNTAEATARCRANRLKY